ncbi:MFS transporter [Pseudolysinimonas yzui]|uniref:MFS transporter n=1 Tax=Pseudolysinimonas yzui TaxID=2708254 RepID=A0A8J3M201_9MICO|nr:MFS transporter [Pseudolysinimonas yzui]GHF15993.1 MFS transporter [Pseudolysinimonas yzui]
MTLTPLKRRLLVASLLTVSFLGALDHTIVSTSLSTIAGELGALQQMSWIVVAYTLAATVSLPLIGKLADGLGARRVFLASLTLFLLASIACGFAQDIVQLTAARVVQGLSSAGLQLMSQTIVANVTTPRERPRLLSILGVSFPVAILVGPVLGGLISDNLSWHWVFWINVPLGLAAFVLAIVGIPRIAGQPRGRFDVAGALTFTVAMVALVLAVNGTVGGFSASTVVLLGVAVVSFVAFFFIEQRVDDPFVPLRLFRNRSVAAGITLSAIIGIGLFSVVSYIPTYIQMAYRTTATVSGLVPIATVLGMLLASLATGFLASRTGRYRRFAIAGTSVAASGLAIMALLPVGLPLWVPMVVMGLVGIGTGAFMSLVIAVVQSAVPRAQTGSVTATLNLVRQVGATVGTAAVGAVIGIGVLARLPESLNASTLTPELVRGLAVGLQQEVAGVYGAVMAPVFAALAGVYAVGVVAAILLPSGRLTDEQPGDPVADPTSAEPHVHRQSA